jgi:hypothetical protein
LQTEPLLCLGREQAIGDRRDCRRGIACIGLHLDTFDRDPRLPAPQRLENAVLNRPPRGGRIRLVQKPAETTAKVGRIQPLARLGHQNDLDRLANILLAVRPRDPAVLADVRWKAHSLSKDLRRIEHHA